MLTKNCVGLICRGSDTPSTVVVVQRGPQHDNEVTTRLDFKDFIEHEMAQHIALASNSKANHNYGDPLPLGDVLRWSAQANY